MLATTQLPQASATTTVGPVMESMQATPPLPQASGSHPLKSVAVTKLKIDSSKLRRQLKWSEKDPASKRGLEFQPISSEKVAKAASRSTQQAVSRRKPGLGPAGRGRVVTPSGGKAVSMDAPSSPAKVSESDREVAIDGQCGGETPPLSPELIQWVTGGEVEQEEEAVGKEALEGELRTTQEEEKWCEKGTNVGREEEELEEEEMEEEEEVGEEQKEGEEKEEMGEEEVEKEAEEEEEGEEEEEEEMGEEEEGEEEEEEMGEEEEEKEAEEEEEDHQEEKSAGGKEMTTKRDDQAMDEETDDESVVDIETVVQEGSIAGKESLTEKLPQQKEPRGRISRGLDEIRPKPRSDSTRVEDKDVHSVQTHKVRPIPATRTLPTEKPAVSDSRVATAPSSRQPTHADPLQTVSRPPIMTPTRGPPQKSSSVHHSLSLRRTRKRTLTMPSGTVAMPSGTAAMPSGTVAMPSGTVAQDLVDAAPQMKRAKPDEPVQEPVVVDSCDELPTQKQELGLMTAKTITQTESMNVATSRTEVSMCLSPPTAGNTKSTVLQQKGKQDCTRTVTDRSPSKRGALRLHRHQAPKLSLRREEVSVTADPEVLRQQSELVVPDQAPSKTETPHVSSHKPGPKTKNVLPSQPKPVDQTPHHHKASEPFCKRPVTLQQCRSKPPSLYAPRGIPASEFTPKIIQCFDDYISQLRRAQSEVPHRVRWGAPVKAHSNQKRNTLVFRIRSHAPSRTATNSDSNVNSSPGNRHLSSAARSERAARRSAIKANCTIPSVTAQQEQEHRTEPESHWMSGTTPTRGSLSTRRKVLNEHVSTLGGNARPSADSKQTSRGRISGAAERSTTAASKGVNRLHSLGTTMHDFSDSENDFEVDNPKMDKGQQPPPQTPTPPPGSKTASSIPSPQHSLEPPPRHHNVLLVDSSPDANANDRESGSPAAMEFSGDETLLYQGDREARNAASSVISKGSRTSTASSVSKWIGRKQGTSSTTTKGKGDASHGGKDLTSTAKKRKRPCLFKDSDSGSGSDCTPDRDGTVQSRAKRQKKVKKGEGETGTGHPSRNLVSEFLGQSSTRVGELRRELQLEDVYSPSPSSPPPRPPQQTTLLFPGSSRGGRRQKGSMRSEHGGAQETARER